MTEENNETKESKIEERKEKIVTELKKYQKYVIWIILGVVIWIGCWIRTRNISLLKDVTTGQYITADPDAMGFLRYVEYLAQNGHMIPIPDMLRYWPQGYSNLTEFSFLSYFITYIYKIVHWFWQTVTIQYIDIIYPVICFAIAMIFFFLLVRKLFDDDRIAILATAFLAVIPDFLFRTMTGVSDKEGLAIMLMFMALYFFILSLKEEKMWKSFTYSAVGGILTGIMGIVWGGVNFLYLTIGVFALLEIMFNRFNTKDLITYAIFVLFAINVSVLGYPARFTYLGFVFSTTTLPMVISLFSAIAKLIFDRFNIKFLKLKLPTGVTFLLIGFISIAIILAALQGPGYLLDKGHDFYQHLVQPFGSTRWSLTVAESQQPYIANLVSSMGWLWLIGVFTGISYLFYRTIEVLNPTRKIIMFRFTTFFVVFLFFFTMSRYASNSILNGESNVSLLLYIGSLFGLVSTILYFYLEAYYKGKDVYNNVEKMNRYWIFVIIWFIIMFVGARSALRLIFTFAPVTTVLFAFLMISLYDKSKSIDEKGYRGTIVAFLIVISIFALYNFEQNSLATAKSIGPSSYDQQWQIGMKWVRDNTPKDSAFAQWWDYGYAIQYGGQRATLTDGGNTLGALNYFVGRAVLTGQTETEALELLKAKNATHLLIVSDEIAKYAAFSSIGSDRNYDRFSWISTFGLNTAQTQETRNSTIYVYQGSYSFDEDFIYNDKVFPSKSSGIAGVFVQVGNDAISNNTLQQPIVAVVFNGQQTNIPLNCVVAGGQQIIFTDKGYPGCFMIIPQYDQATGQVNPIGAGLLLSRRVVSTNFARLYLFDEQSQYFKKVYDDSNTWAPIMVYGGRVIGPMKIWEISYPNNLNIPDYYYKNVVPDPAVELVDSSRYNQ